MINELIMLPINRKPVGGDIVLNITTGGLFIISESTIYAWDNLDHLIPQHLYIISDDIKKDGDLCLDEIRCNSLPENKNNQVSPFVEWQTTNNCGGSRKIIATTDPSLKLPQIPKSFIEYFIAEWNKGNKIDKVDVEYKSGRLRSYGRGFTPSSILINNNTITINI
jgi:hypothetical protein